MNRMHTLFAAILALAVASPLAAREPFTVGGLTAQPGERVSGFLEVPGGVDEGARIPVTLIHGTKPGPVLALIAGTHGYEYAPILALQWIRPQLDPNRISGTVILVHIANLPSFLGRTIYYSPVDGKNLNRVYPGKPDGTVSERIAYVITTEVIERADYVVDLHCGDGNEALRPYTYWMVSGNAKVDEGSRQLALAFGLDHIVIDTHRPNDPQASIYTANTAITRGKPAITTETGQLGQTEFKQVVMALRGVWGILGHLEMMEVLDKPLPADRVVWLDRYEVLRSPETGLFTALVNPGHTVAKGTLLGILSDLFGEKIAEIRAPFAGVVNYVVATPPVSQGEPLAMVSRIQPEK
ncbi:succinylglutamate desuccinylase/aspartoacylase family protein [Acidobacteriia bacterium AH_259_A11_L15]|nr:succinylglutamate desuccinylase/aspartoacylase family protein [Acidobacteriia bacterium AH_259_A11_L15]